MKRKLVSVLMAAALVAVPAVPVMASVGTTQDASVGGTYSCEVVYEKDSSFTVTIPKTITLTENAEKTADASDYNVKVIGAIAGDQWVSVVPAATVSMSTSGKDAVTADVAQSVNKFYDTKTTQTVEADGIKMTSETDGATSTGSVTTQSLLTAGSWSGTLNFEVALNTVTP
jgi:hypothetical protein